SLFSLHPDWLSTQDVRTGRTGHDSSFTLQPRQNRQISVEPQRLFKSVLPLRPDRDVNARRVTFRATEGCSSGLALGLSPLSEMAAGAASKASNSAQSREF